MLLLHRLEDFVYEHKPIVLTIGNFDGVHRGHDALLKHAKAIADTKEGSVTVLTFSNHPSEILRPEQPTPLLCTIAHKLKLIERQQIPHTILLPFTKYLSQHSAASFIERVRSHIPFSHLVLGHDATLGRDRQGNRSTMMQLSMEWGFDVEYISEYRYEGKLISSTLIRQLVQEGKLQDAEVLLGRPYSIYSEALPGKGKGKQIGFPTANLNIKGLCLPPFGVYAISAFKNNKWTQGIANLGIAPTVKEEALPSLEVHLFEPTPDLYGQYIEVVFYDYIRPEKKFEKIQELREQIEKDVETVKKLCLPKIRSSNTTFDSVV
jgi:riboflavin kinase / FMN adenylyltransferase